MSDVLNKLWSQTNFDLKQTYFLNSLTTELTDVAHLKTQFKGWQRTLRNKLKKARQTGAGAQDDPEESDEMLYQLLKKNGSVAAAVKVGKLL